LSVYGAFFALGGVSTDWVVPTGKPDDALRELVQMFRTLTGREPTPEELREARCAVFATAPDPGMPRGREPRH
jgi:hypothetical protein